MPSDLINLKLSDCLNLSGKSSFSGDENFQNNNNQNNPLKTNMQTQHTHQFKKEEADDTTASESSHLESYEKIMTSEGKKLFRCSFPDCGKAFRYESEISRHAVIHFSSRPFPCPFSGCKKTFKRKDALDHHFKLHAKDMSFVCEFPGCDEKFPTKGGLKYHYIKHINERLFRCTFAGCNKSFLTAPQLKQHEKAFASHSRILTKLQVEEEQEQTKSYTDSPSTEYYSPVQKYYLKDESCFPKQEKQEEGTYLNFERNNFQNILSYILKEKSAMESKLEFGDKLISSFITKYEAKLEYNNTQEDFLLWKAPNVLKNFFHQ